METTLTTKMSIFCALFRQIDKNVYEPNECLLNLNTNNVDIMKEIKGIKTDQDKEFNKSLQDVLKKTSRFIYTFERNAPRKAPI